MNDFVLEIKLIISLYSPANLRTLYCPIQPTVTNAGQEVIYREVLPDEALQSIIFCFWELKTKTQLAQSYEYRVVADGCIDIFFDLNCPANNFVMGFCRKFTTFPIGHSFHYIGIRFLPSKFPLLFKVDAKALSDKSQQLSQVIPELANWIATTIKPKMTLNTIVQQLNGMLLSAANKQVFKFDARFEDALQLIVQRNGFLDTETELNTGLSSRQLQRIFNYYIGTTAKTFSNVVRFQFIINAYLSGLNLKDNKLYYSVGFYDQAHFIKSFKTFYGVSPSKAFG